MAEQDKPTPAEMAADLLRDVRKHAAAPQPDRLAALEQFAKDMRKALELLEDDEVPSAVRTALDHLDADLSSAPAPCPECMGGKDMTSSQIRDACLLGASHLRAQARQYSDGAEDAAKNPYKLDKRVVNGLVKDMKKSAEKTDASAKILVHLSERAEALSSTAPAPCPECGGTETADYVGDDEAGWERVPCPRCSAQPAPSDVVIPSWVALALEHEIGNIARDEEKYKAARAGMGVIHPGSDAIANAWAVLAAALRQGGG